MDTEITVVKRDLQLLLDYINGAEEESFFFALMDGSISGGLTGRQLKSLAAAEQLMETDENREAHYRELMGIASQHESAKGHVYSVIVRLMRALDVPGI